MFATLLVSAFLLACSDADQGADDSGQPAAAPGPGTLTLSFRMNADLIESMDEPPIGVFLGSIYAEDDATAMGNNEGAISLEDIEVTKLDLTAGGGPSENLYTTLPYESQIVWVLGCFDTDANGCEDDVHDPITIPTQNKFLIYADVDTPVEIFMDLLRP